MPIVNAAAEARYDRLQDELRNEPRQPTESEIRIKRLEGILAQFQAAIIYSVRPTAPVAVLPLESGHADLKELSETRLAAIHTQNIKQVDLLFGIDDITAALAKSVHNPNLPLCLTLYRIALEQVQAQWQSAITNLGDEQQAFTYLTESTNAQENSLSMQSAFKAVVLGRRITLSTALDNFIYTKDAKKYSLDILDLTFQYFRQQAIDPLIADVYRVNPPSVLTSVETQRRLKLAATISYQQKKLNYFSQHPEQQPEIERLNLCSVINYPIDATCIELVWQKYRLARLELKSQALQILSAVLQHSHAQPDISALKKFRGNWSLLTTLFSQYAPKNHQDFISLHTILAYCRQGEGTLVEWDLLANAICTSITDPLTQAVPVQGLTTQLHCEPRSILLDQLCFYHHNATILSVSTTPKLRSAHSPIIIKAEFSRAQRQVNLYRWYGHALREELPVIRAESLSAITVQCTNQLTVWDETSATNAKRITEIEQCLVGFVQRSLDRDFSDKNITRRNLALLDVLLGPGISKAQAIGTQHFFSPEQQFQRELYWAILTAAQHLFRKNLNLYNETVAWDKLNNFHLGDTLQHERLKVLIEEICKTYSLAFPHFKSRVQSKLQKIINNSKLALPLLQTIELTYQWCLPKPTEDSYKLAQQAMLLRPIDFTQAAIEKISIDQEKHAYHDRVVNYLLTCTSEELGQVVDAFSLVLPFYSTQEERIQIAKAIAHNLAFEIANEQLSFDGLGSDFMKLIMNQKNSAVVDILLARGAVLIPEWQQTDPDLDWLLLKQAVATYRPRNGQDEVFRQKIVDYCTTTHSPDRWTMIVFTLYVTHLDKDVTFFEQALAEAKKTQRFYWLDNRLLDAAQACENLLPETAAMLWKNLPIFFQEFSEIDADVLVTTWQRWRNPEKFTILASAEPVILVTPQRDHRRIDDFTRNSGIDADSEEGLLALQAQHRAEAMALRQEAELELILNQAVLDGVLTLSSRKFQLIGQNWSTLLDYLTTCEPTLKIINLDGQVFSDEDFQRFTTLLPKFWQLKHLSLANCQLSPSRIATNNEISIRISVLTRQLTKCYSLKSLDLSSNQLVKADLLALLMLTHAIPCITSINYSDIPGAEQLTSSIDKQLNLQKHCQVTVFQIEISEEVAINLKNKSSSGMNSRALFTTISSNSRSSSVAVPVKSIIESSYSSARIENRYRLVRYKVRELTYRLGQGAGDSLTSMFQTQKEYFFHRSISLKGHNYHSALKMRLIALLGSKVALSTNLFAENSGQAVASIGYVAGAVGMVVPAASAPLFAFQQTAAQLEQWERENNTKNCAHFWLTISNVMAREEIADFMAALITWRYISGFRQHAMTDEQVEVDASVVIDFIGRNHLRIDPILKESQDRLSYSLHKLGNLMKAIFGTKELAIPLTKAQKVAFDQYAERHLVLSEANKPLPKLIIFASEVRRIKDNRPCIVNDPQLSELDEWLRAALFEVPKKYQQHWDDLGYYERLFTQWILGHGGDKSVVQCKLIEEMICKLPLETLIANVRWFLLDNVGRSGLRKDSLHTYLIEQLIDAEEKPMLWQEKVVHVVTTASTDAVVTAPCFGLNATSLFSSERVDRLQKRDQLLEVSQLLKVELTQFVKTLKKHRHSNRI